MLNQEPIINLKPFSTIIVNLNLVHAELIKHLIYVTAEDVFIIKEFEVTTLLPRCTLLYCGQEFYYISDQPNVNVHNKYYWITIMLIND